jgi:hypothetical protein
MQIYFNHISKSRPFYNHYFFATQIEKLIIGGHRGVGQKPVQSHCGLIEGSTGTFYAGLEHWENIFSYFVARLDRLHALSLLTLTPA